MNEPQALRLAVDALKHERRRHYAAGEAAYKMGIDFEFAKRGHMGYEIMSEAIAVLEKRIAAHKAAKTIAKQYKEKP